MQIESVRLLGFLVNSSVRTYLRPELSEMGKQYYNTIPTIHGKIPHRYFAYGQRSKDDIR
jgi:hypothetical protein